MTSTQPIDKQRRGAVPGKCGKTYVMEKLFESSREDKNFWVNVLVSTASDDRQISFAVYYTGYGERYTRFLSDE